MEFELFQKFRVKNSLTELWSISLFATAIETSPDLHCGQGVLHGALWTLQYDHVDMHKITPTIEEVIALTKWLTDKQFSAKLAVWILGYVAIFGLLKQLSPQLHNLCKFAH
jgi:hypothetical protein